MSVSENYCNGCVIKWRLPIWYFMYQFSLVRRQVQGAVLDLNKRSLECVFLPPPPWNWLGLLIFPFPKNFSKRLPQTRVNAGNEQSWGQTSSNLFPIISGSVLLQKICSDQCPSGHSCGFEPAVISMQWMHLDKKYNLSLTGQGRWKHIFFQDYSSFCVGEQCRR